MRRIVRETAAHYEDLQKAALVQGVPGEEAAARWGGSGRAGGFAPVDAWHYPDGAVG